MTNDLQRAFEARISKALGNLAIWRIAEPAGSPEPWSLAFAPPDGRAGGTLGDAQAAGTAAVIAPAELAGRVVEHVERLVEALVEKPLRRAVLARTDLFATQWPMGLEAPLWAGRSTEDRALAWADLAEVTRWPAEVSPADVARALDRVRANPAAATLARALRAGLIHPRPMGHLVNKGHADPSVSAALQEWPIIPCAVVVAAELAVEADRLRPSIALDAGSHHRELLDGWRNVTKSAAKRHTFKPAEDAPGKIELLDRGKSVESLKSVQLLTDLPEKSAQEALSVALRQWRGWEGLRNWAAFQRLLSVEGGRAGWFRWTLDAHLDALGYEGSHRRSVETRSKIARMVESFTRFELAVYRKDGTLRDRSPLFNVAGKSDALEDGTWVLNGMELRINPFLYQGVRSASGELGSNWHPAPVELAQINHGQFPHAIALGLILPIRWRLALNEEDESNRERVRLSGESLLALAGIVFDEDHPARTWDMLEQNLAELQRRGGLGRWTWEGLVDGHPAAASMCDLWPPAWMADRTVRNVRPVEARQLPPVATGADLKGWRERQGLSQVAAAKELKVGIATVKRAEASPGDALGPALREAFRKRDGAGQ